MLDKLPYQASPEAKLAHYSQLLENIQAQLEAGCDAIAAMATIVCELHNSFDYYHWTGFYRSVRPEHLQIGPYQGGHGCIDIPFSRGVCGAAARQKKTQLVADVHSFQDHIACSSSTLSEIVVPVINAAGEVLAVLDVDSDHPAAFDSADQEGLESICRYYAERYPRLSY